MKGWNGEEEWAWREFWRLGLNRPALPECRDAFSMDLGLTADAFVALVEEALHQLLTSTTHYSTVHGPHQHHVIRQATLHRLNVVST
jgi:hypothetical protein